MNKYFIELLYAGTAVDKAEVTPDPRGLTVH